MTDPLGSHEVAAKLSAHRDNDLRIIVDHQTKPIIGVAYSARQDVLYLVTGNHGVHTYLSTACYHAHADDAPLLHLYCQGTVGSCGTKHPARCKFCPSTCRCDCHEQPAPDLEPGALAVKMDLARGDLAAALFILAEEASTVAGVVQRTAGLTRADYNRVGDAFARLFFAYQQHLDYQPLPDATDEAS